MRGALLIVVLTSVCVLQAGSDVPIQPDFDIQQFSGKWYPIALVMDRERLKNIEVLDNIAQPSDNGDLLLRVHYYQDGACGTNDIQFLQTDEPGKFTIAGGLSTMRIVEIDYSSYCIFHIEAAGSNILHLYSREPQVSDAVKEKYMNHITSMQFPADNIHYEKRTGECPD
ncbi:UNVERIFIED_CONTAM: hypothetical protein K2H54_040663 [Gekko kuhli]